MVTRISFAMVEQVAYIRLKQLVCDMQVVNDTVECAEKDI